LRTEHPDLRRRDHLVDRVSDQVALDFKPVIRARLANRLIHRRAAAGARAGGAGEASVAALSYRFRVKY
jgi:hypothetical protein